MSKAFNALVDDVRFVIAEIERLQGPDRGALGPWDGMCWMPSPKGGHLLIGREAERRIDRMVIAALGGTTYARRVDATRVKGEFKAALSELVALESIDGSAIQKALSASVKRAAKDCRARSHFFPAHLMQLDKPGPFAIGNVHFRPSKQFVEESSDALAAMVLESSSGGRPLHKSQEIADEAADYYLAFGWVIGVTIEGCDAVIAQERAEQCAAAAVHIIRLLGSDQGAQSMAIGGPRANDTREANLWESEGKFEWRLKRSSLGSARLDTWLEWIAWPGNDQVMRAAGAYLEAIRDPSCDWPVALRWIDAVTWFGQAVQDPSDAAAVIKFVTAIERIVMTGDKGDKVYATFCRRAGAVAYSVGSDLAELQEKAAEIYDARSRLAHGSLSPFAPEVRLMRHQAGEFARTVLVSAGAFLFAFGHVARPTTVKQLGKVWEDLADKIAADGGVGLFASNPVAGG